MLYFEYGARPERRTPTQGVTMRTTATNVKPGDRVRGIGLTVEYNEPETDFTRRLTGVVSTREEVDGEEQTSEFTTSVVLPNEHLVNVRRSDASFRETQLEDLAVLRSRLLNGDATDEETVEAAWELGRRDRAFHPRHGSCELLEALNTDGVTTEEIYELFFLSLDPAAEYAG